MANDKKTRKNFEAGFNQNTGMSAIVDRIKAAATAITGKKPPKAPKALKVSRGKRDR